MRKTQSLLVIFALVFAAGSTVIAQSPPPARPIAPASAEVVDDRPAPVPMVPIPPAVMGSLASVGVMIGLWNSRHRRWLTLR